MNTIHIIVRRAAVLAAAVFAVDTGAHAGSCVLDPRIDDRAIVHVRESSDIGAFLDAFRTAHPELTFVETADSIPGRPIHLIDVGLPKGYTDEFMDALAADLEVNWLDFLVSGDFLYENQAPEGKTGSTYIDGLEMGTFSEQYADGLIGLPLARERATGRGVVIAVLDTGIDASHSTLADRVLPFGWDFVDDDDDPHDGGNATDDDGDGLIDEAVGHGTFVAGLLALVAPDAGILPVRVLNGDGVGDEWTLTEALYFAIDRGVEVINLSLASTYDTNTVKQAIMDAANLGIVVIAAAGNEFGSDCREHPAMDDVGPEDRIVRAEEISGAFGVAATDHEDIKADFSNVDDHLVISAPGNVGPDPRDPSVSIISTVPGDTFASWEGTSFATAIVSGTAALVRGQHPEWPPDLVTYLEIELILTETAVDIYPQNQKFEDGEQLGAGRIDAGAAVGRGPVAPPLGDLDGNGLVNVGDLLRLLGAWRETHSSADLDGDGTVAFSDLIILLQNWS